MKQEFSNHMRNNIKSSYSLDKCEIEQIENFSINSVNLSNFNPASNLHRTSPSFDLGIFFDTEDNVVSAICNESEGFYVDGIFKPFFVRVAATESPLVKGTIDNTKTVISGDETDETGMRCSIDFEESQSSDEELFFDAISEGCESLSDSSSSTRSATGAVEADGNFSIFLIIA